MRQSSQPEKLKKCKIGFDVKSSKKIMFLICSNSSLSRGFHLSQIDQVDSVYSVI